MSSYEVSITLYHKGKCQSLLLKASLHDDPTVKIFHK